jgi:hypothetical protein
MRSITLLMIMTTCFFSINIYPRKPCMVMLSVWILLQTKQYICIILYDSSINIYIYRRLWKNLGLAFIYKHILLYIYMIYICTVYFASLKCSSVLYICRHKQTFSNILFSFFQAQYYFSFYFLPNFQSQYFWPGLFSNCSYFTVLFRRTFCAVRYVSVLA